MQKPTEHSKKAIRLRSLARGYCSLKREKAKFYDSAADVLEGAAKGSDASKQFENRI
jgi:hypothetical protein